MSVQRVESPGKVESVRRTRFEMGRLVATPGAAALLPPEELAGALRRHLSGDWGDMCAEDKLANEGALKEGARLMSAYEHQGERFWIITEADRSATTVLLPDEY